MQNTLSATQIEAFYHDNFVRSQIEKFSKLVPAEHPELRQVLDVGGGCGYFAHALKNRMGISVRVLDSDPSSIAECRTKGLDAELGNALAPLPRGDEEIVCFNLILHHLIGHDETTTRQLQCQALAAWHGRAQAVFVDEYIYDSYVGHLSGQLIYAITRSKLLSWMAGQISRVVPSLRANTFGVGVRFRSRDEWVGLFESLGYEVKGWARGAEENVSPARRLLLIRSCRRDSFLLHPANQATKSLSESAPNPA